MNYWIGSAYQARGNSANARAYWQKSATPERAMAQPSATPGGNISVADLQTYYQALSLRRLGQTDKAERLLQGLIAIANESLHTITPGPAGTGTLSELQAQRFKLASAYYAAGLGYLGLQEKRRQRSN